MKLYTYRCKDCGLLFQFTEDKGDTTACPICGGVAVRE